MPTVLAQRAGGMVHITNEEMYDAMLPGKGERERFLVTETPGGLSISIGDG